MTKGNLMRPVFYGALLTGSLTLNLLQAWTFPVHNSADDAAHEAAQTSVLMQAIFDNVIANGGKTVTLPAGRFYLDSPIDLRGLPEGFLIQGASPDHPTELTGLDERRGVSEIAKRHIR